MNIQRCAMTVLCWMIVFSLKPDFAMANETELAKEKFIAGTKLFSEGKHAAAADAFLEAYQLDANWKVQYNVGQSLAASKQYGRAVEAFELYLSLGGDDIPQERQDEVMQELTALRMKTGMVAVRGDATLEIFVDGILRGLLPLPGKLRLAAGVVHTLEAKRDGEVVFSKAIRVSGGESTEVEVPGVQTAETVSAVSNLPIREAKTSLSDETSSNETSNAPAQDTSVRKSSSGRVLPAIGWTLIGFGGAAIVAGAVTGGLAIGRNKDLQSNCDADTNICDSAYADDLEKVENTAKASTILFSAGLPVAVVGTVLLLVAKKKQRNESALQVWPIMGTSMGIHGSF